MPTDANGPETGDEGLRREALGSVDRVVTARQFWRVVGPAVNAKPVAELSVYLKEGTLTRYDPHTVGRLVAGLLTEMWQ